MRNLNKLVIVLSIAITISSCTKDTTNPTLQHTTIKHTSSNGQLSVSSSSAMIYSSITIYGNNFSIVSTDNIVKINGVPAIINSSTANQIVATIPSNATTGKITVESNGNTLTSLDDFKVLHLVKTGSIYNVPVSLTSITSDKSGNLYGTLYSGNIYGYSFIFKYNNGKLTHVYDSHLTSATDAYNLTNLVFDKNGNIFIAQNHGTSRNGLSIDSAQIIKITPDGKSSVFVTGNSGTSESTFFSEVSGIMIDKQDNIYVTTYTDFKKITPSGAVSSIGGNIGLLGINGSAVDNLGNFYWSANNLTNYNVHKINQKGSVSTLLTSKSPLGPVVVDEANNIFFISNSSNVKIINQAGISNTLTFPDNPYSFLTDNSGNYYTISLGVITRYVLR